MDSTNFVADVAIVAPFLFAAWVITIGVRSKERKRRENTAFNKENEEFYRELAKGIRDLERRIENLEIIIRNRGKQ